MARKPADQSVNREDILLAAAEVLRRNGYEATTMKDIAAQVNLTAASLYHHFTNKDSLLLAVLEGGLEQVIEQLEPIMAADHPCAQKLRQMIRVHITSLTEHTAVGAAMVFEVRPLMAFRPPPRNGNHFDADAAEDFIRRRDAFFARRDYFEDLFRRVVREGVDRGEFQTENAAILVKTMLGAHNWVAIWYRDTGPLSGEQIAALVADTFLRSLQPKG